MIYSSSKKFFIYLTIQNKIIFVEIKSKNYETKFVDFKYHLYVVSDLIIYYEDS